jgi:hypothetical protein
MASMVNAPLILEKSIIVDTLIVPEIWTKAALDSDDTSNHLTVIDVLKLVGN